MNAVGLVFAVIAAVVHVYIFVLESVLFPRPAARKTFGVTEAELPAVRPWAFNQGFYNLFLAVGIAAGIAQIASGATVAGRSIVLFACLCMVWAGIVLFVTSKRFFQPALVQLVPPLVAIVASFLLT
jgi:putative membrane protein